MNKKMVSRAICTIRVLASVRRAALLTLFCMLCFVSPALAEELQCVEVTVAGTTEHALTQPLEYPVPLAVIRFNKEVSSLEERDEEVYGKNCQSIHLVDPSGNEVSDVKVTSTAASKDAFVLYVETTDWLAPLSKYRLVIDKGIQSLDGSAVSAEAWGLTFRTNDYCYPGFYLHEAIPLAIVIVAFVMGIAAGLFKRRKNRERQHG